MLSRRGNYSAALWDRNAGNRWDYYTNRINDLNKRIEAAKQERDDVQIGDIAEDVFNQMGI